MRTLIVSITTFFVLAIGSFLLMASFSSPAEKNGNRSTSSGELSFTIRTVTANGTYSPKHVLAIWVEDIDGFVKTRKAMASQRKQYLYTWAAASNFNTVDAITGPTLTSHQTHTVTWDCTDLGGNIVPDGDYVVYAEFTDKHAQGPLYSMTFTKGPNPLFLTPPDETYFKDIVLTFTPYVCDFTASETDVCQGEIVVFTDESVNASSWEWDFGEGAVPATSSTQGPHAVSYSTPGIRTVSLTINGNLTETKDDFMTIHDAMEAGFEYGGSDLTVEFTNASINATTYLWDFGDGNTSAETDPVHIYSSAGSYMVSLIATNSYCEDTVSHEISVPLVGLEEIYSENLVQIYPNPCSSTARLRLTNHEQRYLISDLYMISGERIKRLVNEVVPAGIHEIEIDMSDLPAGMYYIRVQAGEQVGVGKIVKID